MNNPTPWNLLLLLALLLSGTCLVVRWRSSSPAGRFSALFRARRPAHFDDMPARVNALRSEMNQLIARSAGQPQDNRAYESLDEALQRGQQPQPRGHTRPIVVTQAAQTHQGLACREPLYATDDLQLRERSDLTQVLARGHLVLGPNSRVRSWAHADKTLLLGEHSVASHQLSSGRGIALAAGCTFERLQAPVMVMGRPLARRRTARSSRCGTSGSQAEARPALPEQPPLPRATPWGASGWRVDGDCTIEPGHHFRGSLVVSGTLHIGADAVVEGDIKVQRGVVVGASASVSGALLAGQGIQIHEEAVLSGPVVCGALLQIGDNVRLGSLAVPTSVSAPVIHTGEGVIAHGTVWATRSGRVGGAA